jgi:hypothetical protein
MVTTASSQSFYYCDLYPKTQNLDASIFGWHDHIELSSLIGFVKFNGLTIFFPYLDWRCDRSSNVQLKRALFQVIGTHESLVLYGKSSVK